MQIALLGGTGDIGEGLALRWGRDTDHEIIIGSRDPDKARRKAGEYEADLASRGVDRAVSGFQNAAATKRAEVVILSVPAYHVVGTIEAVAEALDAGDILVTPAVGMKRDDDGLHYNRPSAGSVAALCGDAAPSSVSVVGAFQNLAAGRLADLETEIDVDTLVFSDDEAAKATVTGLANEIAGLRALDAGRLANAAEVESLTPLLINLATYNEDLEQVGVKFS